MAKGEGKTSDVEGKTMTFKQFFHWLLNECSDGEMHKENLKWLYHNGTPSAWRKVYVTDIATFSGVTIDGDGYEAGERLPPVIFGE